MSAGAACRQSTCPLCVLTWGCTCTVMSIVSMCVQVVMLQALACQLNTVSHAATIYSVPIWMALPLPMGSAGALCHLLKG